MTRRPRQPTTAAAAPEPGRGSRQRPDQRAHPHHPGDPGAAAVGRPASVRELRRRRRAGRLLREVRHQGAERARPLPRAARTLGGRGLRPRHPAHPQRGRDGAARRRDRSRPRRARRTATASPTPTAPTRRRLAGARAAREVLRTPLPRGMGTPESRLSAVAKVFADAVEAANDAVSGFTPGGLAAPAVRTFVAAIIEGSVLSYAKVGDTRAYWLPDGAPGAMLTRRRLRGADADRGRDGPRSRPRVRAAGTRDHPLARPGRAGPHAARGASGRSTRPAGCWSAPTACGTTPPSRRRWSPRCSAAGTTEPAALALALIECANAQGGIDNITVALARIAGQNAGAPAPSRPSGATEGVRWLSSPPPSTRTSSCPTAAPTSTRSSRSAAPAPAPPASPAAGSAGEIIIVDTSGSMGPATMAAAKQAAQAALGRDRRRHLVRRHRRLGPGDAGLSRRSRRGRAWCRWTPRPGRTRPRRSARSSAAAVRRSAPGSTWPARSSRRCRRSASGTRSCSPTVRTARTPDKLDAAIRSATGVFQCDCRGAGTDWQVEEIRRIAQALLGTVDIIPEPDQMQAAVPADDAHRR